MAGKKILRDVKIWRELVVMMSSLDYFCGDAPTDNDTATMAAAATIPTPT